MSDDSTRRAIIASLNPEADRGPSDFDTRHQLNGFVNYDLPALFSKSVGNKLSRNWSVDSVASLRSARPVNVLYLFPTSFGVAYFRPDVVAGESLYIFDPAVEGGRRINPASFIVPIGLDQGDLPRNSLRGFPFYQIDLALRRQFNLSENVALQFRTDVFNIFNHPNFADPVGRDRVLGSVFSGSGAVFSGGPFTPNATFGRSSSLLGQSLSGTSESFGSFYNTGGPRTLRFSLKLRF